MMLGEINEVEGAVLPRERENCDFVTMTRACGGGRTRGRSRENRREESGGRLDALATEVPRRVIHGDRDNVSLRRSC